MTETEGTFRILAIDGGGVRGIFPAHILRCLHERLHVDPAAHFDLIAGTSTGAIIAAGLACGKSSADIEALYLEKAGTIFGTPIRSIVPKNWKPGFHSIYDHTPLGTVLEEVFGSTTLGELDKPLLIPATDVGHGSVHVFKSSYSAEFTRDATVRVKDAVLASCAAPTFFDPASVDNYLLCDGGVWANNPALCAVIDARRRLGVGVHRIRILTLGTGLSRTAYGTDRDRKWGLLNGWRRKEFINFLMSLQAQSTQNYLQLLLRPEQLLRLNFESDKPLPLDDPKLMGDLMSHADRTFTHRSEQLQQFFGLNRDS